MTLRTILALSAIAVLWSCARPIPNRVTTDEYSIYSDWTTNHFIRNPPEHLYFSSRTGVFDPQSSNCHTALEKDGVSRSLIEQMHALGEAEYPLNFNSPPNLRIPWAYKEVEIAPDLPPGSFHVIAFSRVAFNRDHTEALFAFFDACAFGDCGKGGYIQGRKQNGHWSFRGVGCVTVA